MSKRSRPRLTPPSRTRVGKLLDLRAAVDYLGGAISYWTLRALVVAGVLPTVRLPSPRPGGGTIRRVLIARSDLDALIARSKTAVPSGRALEQQNQPVETLRHVGAESRATARGRT
jgi:hypothetical protein